jgi:hypothetical protein
VSSSSLTLSLSHTHTHTVQVRVLLTSATSAVVRLPASAAEMSDPEAIAAAQVRG